MPHVFLPSQTPIRVLNDLIAWKIMHILMRGGPFLGYGAEERFRISIGNYNIFPRKGCLQRYGRHRHYDLYVLVTELAEQSVDPFKIREVLNKTGEVKLVTIWITAKHTGNQPINENIRSVIAPHFDQAKSNYHYPALRNSAGDHLYDLTPMNCLFEAG